MVQYIDKSAVVAEIESLKRTTFTNFDEGVNCAVQTLLEIIDTLEVKEVDEEYNGKAMLHVLEKGVKQGRREIINRACKWLRKELVNFEDYSGMGEEFISDFRKAMEE